MEIVNKINKDACHIEGFNECAEQIAKLLDAWFDTDTQDMTLINELIEKHLESKRNGRTRNKTNT